MKDSNINAPQPLGFQQHGKKEEHRQVPMEDEGCLPDYEASEYRSHDDFVSQRDSHFGGSPTCPATSGRGAQPQQSCCTLVSNDEKVDDEDIHEIFEVYRRSSFTACMGSEEDLLMASCTENWLLDWFDSLSANFCWSRLPA